MWNMQKKLLTAELGIFALDITCLIMNLDNHQVEAMFALTKASVESTGICYQDRGGRGMDLVGIHKPKFWCMENTLFREKR